MERRTSSLRLGLFVFVGIIALIAAIFFVGRKEGIFGQTFRVSAYFTTIEGVRVGAPVRFAGVDIGVVDRILISPENNKVRLDLKLNTNVKNFIKKDSYAMIEQEGLVGNKFVTVSVGTASSEEVGDGDVILSKDPFRLAVLLEETQATIVNTRRATDEFAKMLASVNKGKGTLGKLVTDEDVYRVLKSATATADSSLRKTAEEFANIPRFIFGVTENLNSVVSNVDTLMIAAKDVFARVNRGEGTLGALIAQRALYDSLLVIVENTIAMTEEAKSGAGRFDENMEALRHNWFFKGYFEERGYWDKAEFEKDLDQKITELRRLEAKLSKQSEELKQREEQLRKREEALQNQEQKEQ